MALAADAPVLVDGRPATPAAWERISRDAGVVGDDTAFEPIIIRATMPRGVSV